MNKIFKEIILYTKCYDFFLQVYAVQDLLENKYAIVIVNYIYLDEEMQHESTKKTYFELLQEEFKESFLDWFATLEDALNDHINNFFINPL